MKLTVKKECTICGTGFTAHTNCAKYCDKCREIVYSQQKRKGRRKINFKSNLDKTVHELKIYNHQNGTRLTYGKYQGLKMLGKIH